MGGWIGAHGDAIVAGTAAVVVAVIGVLTAEGGRRRRLLKQIQTQVELLAQLKDSDVDEELRGRVKRNVEEDLKRFVPTTWERWSGRIGAVAKVYFVLAYGGVAFDFLQSRARGTHLSPTSRALLEGSLIGMAGVVVGAALILGGLVVGARFRYTSKPPRH